MSLLDHTNLLVLADLVKTKPTRTNHRNPDGQWRPLYHGQRILYVHLDLPVPFHGLDTGHSSKDEVHPHIREKGWAATEGVHSQLSGSPRVTIMAFYLSARDLPITTDCCLSLLLEGGGKRKEIKKRTKKSHVRDQIRLKGFNLNRSGLN
ncbi:hypothetical protein BDV26DRAFT_251645 [Aspergillus bertholletiae]|uniref:Uncharacterized protein n=1 Tax=Aspergillus bertholletiae TaxID=1226010 RepID=A0A5N7BP29_9EURO|nr:hypothetical protein BDV26DRAFT_251645 [Aspergillus bertholletiae]